MKCQDLHAITRANEEIFRLEVLDAIVPKAGCWLVDLGCGNGSFTTIVGKKAGAKNTVGLDFKIDVRNKILSQIILIQADLNFPIPLLDQTADVIIAIQVVEHIARTDQLIKETYRILKPEGQLILSTPNLASWHNIGALIMGWQPFSSQVSDEYFLGNPAHPSYKRKIEENQAHLRLFTGRSLKEILMAHGFDKVEVKGAGYYPYRGFLARVMSRLDPVHSAYLTAVATKSRVSHLQCHFD